MIRLAVRPGERQPEILGLIAAMDAKLFWSDSPLDPAGKFWWLAYDGKEVVGYAGMHWLNGTTMFLCRAGVLAPHRGRGIHKKLIAARVRYAKTLGCSSIVTYTVDNHASSNALIARGFRFYKPKHPMTATIGEVHYLRRRLD